MSKSTDTTDCMVDSEESMVSDTLPSSEPTSDESKTNEQTERIHAVSLANLTAPPIGGGEDEILKKRFLCKGGGAMFIGPTGVGKSSLIMQLVISWAMGETQFGMEPAKPLKVLIIQAENDEGDMAEMRDGVLKGMNLYNDPEIGHCLENIIICSDCGYSGEDFFEQILEPLVGEHEPDLVIIDPALAYLGAATSDQESVSEFLRNQLNPILRRFHCGCIIVHHANKPQNGNGKKPGNIEHSYLASGSIEWGNWARAVITLTPNCEDGRFVLRAAKRGGRLGWREPDGSTVSYTKILAHSKNPDQICWTEVKPDIQKDDADDSKVTSPKPKSNAEKIMARIPQDGSTPKNDVIGASDQHGLGSNTARKIIKSLIDSGELFEHKVKREGKRPEVHLARHPQS